MEGNQTFEINIGECTDCSNCGLCEKGGKYVPGNKTEGNNSAEMPQYDFTRLEAGRDNCIVAVELGFGSIRYFCLNAENCEQLGVLSSLNPLKEYADDVLALLKDVKDGKGENYRKILRENIKTSVEKVCKGMNPKLIVLSADTVMEHIYLGWETDSLTEEKHLPLSSEAVLDILDGTKVFVIPVLSTFAGGDVISGIYAKNLNLSKEEILFIGFNSNTEIFVGNEEKVVASDINEGTVSEFEQIHSVEDATKLLGKAKEAIKEKIEVLLKAKGETFKDISRVVIFGSKALYLNADDFCKENFLPEEVKEKTEIYTSLLPDSALKIAKKMWNDIEGLDKELKQTVSRIELI